MRMMSTALRHVGLALGLCVLSVASAGATESFRFAPLTPERQPVSNLGPTACNIVYLDPWWTLYHNGDGALWVSWNVVPGMTGDMTITLSPSGGGSATVPSSAGFAAVDILNTNIDPFPPGYALVPGPTGTYAIDTWVEINGQWCGNRAYIGALPPPTDVVLKSNGPAVEPGGQYALIFRQKFPLTVPNTILYYIPSPRSLEAIDIGGQIFTFWFGGTATVGQDYLGPASNPYAGTSITYPAHDQSEAVHLTMINDNCPEPTENVVTYWIYEADAGWGLTNLHWALLGAPSYWFDILDDDANKPPCAIEYPHDEE